MSNSNSNSIYNLDNVARITQQPSPPQVPRGGIYDLGHVAAVHKHFQQQRSTQSERRKPGRAYDLSSR